VLKLKCCIKKSAFSVLRDHSSIQVQIASRPSLEHGMFGEGVLTTNQNTEFWRGEKSLSCHQNGTMIP
jgi:hypothetical protein